MMKDQGDRIDHGVMGDDQIIEAVRDLLKVPEYKRSLQEWIIAREPPPESPDPSDPIEKWKQEFSIFDARLEELYADPRYREKYVAMKDGKVIDVDEDEFGLADRIERQFPHEVVIVAKVTQEEEPILEVSSPELA